jgi:hypothetical protein
MRGRRGGELRDIYSGVDPVPIRAGRWWEVGSTPFEGARIREWRPRWSILHKSHAEDIALYGSEKEKWAHNPILHPLRYLKNPYYLEEKHYKDRPCPVTSPAFTNVPLIGQHILAELSVQHQLVAACLGHLRCRCQLIEKEDALA